MRTASTVIAHWLSGLRRAAWHASDRESIDGTVGLRSQPKERRLEEIRLVLLVLVNREVRRSV